MSIDITKAYTTRSGLPVRIYAADGKGTFPVHGAVYSTDQWYQVSWLPCGKRCDARHADEWDLVPVKTWRAWKHGEEPKFFMAKAATKGGQKVLAIDSSKVGNCDNFFNNFIWIHEDGTTTPCGVCE